MLRAPFLVDSRQPTQRLRDHLRVVSADAAVHRDRSCELLQIGRRRSLVVVIVHAVDTDGEVWRAPFSRGV